MYKKPCAMAAAPIVGPAAQPGIQTYYSGTVGEIRHSRFYNLTKDFSDKGCLSFKYVLKGQENYVVDGQHFEINAQQVLFLSDNKAYQGSIDYPGMTKGLCIDLNINLKQHAQMDALGESELFLFSPEFKTQKVNFLNPNLRALLEQIEGCQAQEQALRLEEILQDISLQVVQLEAEYVERIQTIPTKKMAYKKELFTRLLAAKNFVHDYQRHSIQLADIAKASGLSAFYLHRLFRQVFGATPAQYQERLRLVEAKAYLKRFSVKETSYLVGFADDAYFSKRFKKHFGIPPGKFARMQR